MSEQVEKLRMLAAALEKGKRTLISVPDVLREAAESISAATARGEKMKRVVEAAKAKIITHTEECESWHEQPCTCGAQALIDALAALGDGE